MSNTALPLPPHYDPARAADWAYSPNELELFEAANRWRREHDLRSAAAQRFDLHLLVVDAQKDFCLPQGALYVAGRSGTGAVDDSRRIAEFIYRNLGLIKNITVTMDSHLAFQVFFPSFWVDPDGQPARPYTAITADDVASGRFRPNPHIASWLSGGDYEWLSRQVLDYCRRLEETGKYTLYLWPPHCILGSEGHALVGLIQEARIFHAFARSAQSWTELKGSNPLTENYSILRPEVLSRHDGLPLAEKNTGLIRTLLAADAVAIVGQASSHCVKETIEDLLSEIAAVDPALARKVYVLSDCMSPVVVPGADFTPQAEEALRGFADRGVHVVKSTDPVESWPEIEVMSDG